MSEETAKKLSEAKELLNQHEMEAERLKQECLTRVSSGMADKLDAFAKKIAQAEPQVATGLGPEGIKRLREELREAVTAIGADLQAASSQIKWSSSARGIDVHSALFSYLYGPRLKPLTTILQSYGFLSGSNREEILPQDLYSMNSFDDVATALHALSGAQRTVTARQKEHDDSTVDSLWDGA